MTTEPRGIWIVAKREALGPQLSRARGFVKQAAGEFGFADRDVEAITLAVHEAVANAVIHGEPCCNGCEGVELRTWCEEGAAVFSVRDCGTIAAAPPRGGDLLDERGRGLPLMAALMDGVELVPEPDRTVVRLKKRLEAAAA
jgi:anti-sigma regulatory factor (Ser/Thr protein kinase)